MAAPDRILWQILGGRMDMLRALITHGGAEGMTTQELAALVGVSEATADRRMRGCEMAGEVEFVDGRYWPTEYGRRCARPVEENECPF